MLSDTVVYVLQTLYVRKSDYPKHWRWVLINFIINIMFSHFRTTGNDFSLLERRICIVSLQHGKCMNN